MEDLPYDPSEEPKLITIQRHIADHQRQHPSATGEFSLLLRNLALAAKIVSREVRRAGLVNILGKASRTNESGDDVKKLDLFANQVIINTMETTGQICAMASEEDERIIPISDDYPHGHYVLLYDPLDGSSNIELNITIGTIFSVLRRITADGPGTEMDALQPGFRQEAAGYIMYGSSTIMIYSAGHGVHGFTLDPTIGSFLLSHPDLTIPRSGRTYSVNEGNRRLWDDGFRRFVEHLQEPDAATQRPYSARYTGSMIADIHRTILTGGIFAYPGDAKNPDGKLRLLYEANPMAFLIEQAGGKASDGRRRILDIVPQNIHQRVPVIMGSVDDMTICEEFIAGSR